MTMKNDHTDTNDVYKQILDQCEVNQELGNNKMVQRMNLEH